MRKFYLVLAVSLCAHSAGAQTIITYGNSTVSKDEFWRAYNKNKQVVADKEKSLREYIDLYSNFKLKVKAAQDLRLDTLQQLKNDVDNFRNQIMENYLSDEKGLKRLQTEAFDRSQRDVHTVHFSISATGSDSLNAEKAIRELYSQLLTGNGNDESVVQSISAKYVPVREADIGFITAFTLPYEYENIVYNIRPGKYSPPYRSKNSWHIFKLVEEKPAAGKWKIAQILFSFPPDANDEKKNQIKRRADSVYNLLQKGSSFGAVAKEFSDDKITYLTEGELPEFTSGKFAYSFESEVFKLKTDGDISRPFSTAFGYHIVKRISQVPVINDRNDEAYQFELKQKILADPRINIEREKFAREIVTRTGFKLTGNVYEYDLLRFADTLMKNFSESQTKNSPISKKVIALFADKTPVFGHNWLKFVHDYKGNSEQFKGESNKELWQKFVIYTSVEFYKKHLEAYNEDFRFQMQEFKEGNMLFEVMEKNVWNKASADASALKKYYSENKSKYKWESSADVLVFNCSSGKIAENALSALIAGKDWKRLAEESSATIQSDSGRYELSQITGVETAGSIEPGNFSKIVKNTDGSASFVKYVHVYTAGMQRSFDEARGLVINDYQNILEQKWLASLKNKYPIRVNESVFKTLLK